MDRRAVKQNEVAFRVAHVGAGQARRARVEALAVVLALSAVAGIGRLSRGLIEGETATAIGRHGEPA